MAETPSEKPDAVEETAAEPVAEPVVDSAAEPTDVAATHAADSTTLVDEDRPPELAGPYEQVAADAMPPSLLDDDRKTGRVITIMLCTLFTYVLFAMGYVVYVTWKWTR